MTDALGLSFSPPSADAAAQIALPTTPAPAHDKSLLSPNAVPKSPTQSAPGTPRYAPPDTAQVRELLQLMKGTLAQLGATFDTLHEQSSRVASLGPAVDSATQIQSLRRQMRAQDKRQEGRIGEVKHLVKDVLKDQIAEHMRAQIAEQIKEELAAQVRAQVGAQLAARLPGSLAAQTAESKRQLAEVRCSLVNSEARRANSVLRASSLEEPLARVLRPADGAASALYPKDLKSLFAYDAVAAKKLAQDYELPVSDQREKNLNRFMSHIGIPFHLIPVPLMDAPSANALGITMG
ncbi:hypothetical protein AURDEDRAFT_114090, partial [Auricularia subglabra TFB-10046 SS5]